MYLFREGRPRASHTLSWITESETAVSETGHEECEVCGYRKASVKLPKTAPAQPTYDDLSNGDSNHTPIAVILECVEDGTTCYDSERDLFENKEGKNGYTLDEVAWDAASGKWYCDVTIHAADYIEYYSGTKQGEWTLHELAENEAETRTVRFWYMEDYAAKGTNPWRTEDGYSGTNGNPPQREVTFHLVHTKISRTINCEVISVTKNSVELSAHVSQLADDWEAVFYAMSDTPDTVPDGADFSIFSSFEDLEPDTTYYFWAKVMKNNQTGLQEAISQPVQVTTGHDWDTTWSGNATHHWHECTADSCTLTDDSEKFGYGAHTGGIATCHTRAVCDECGLEYGELDTTNHEGGTEVRNAIEATCTEDGYTGDSFCLGCGEKIAEGNVVTAFGHTYDSDWKSDDTNHWHECACGAKADEAAHRFKWVIDKKATETEKGSKHEQCEECGYQKDAVEIPATGMGTDDPTAPSTPAKPSNTTQSENNKPKYDTAKNSNSPQTGDDGNLTIWIYLFVLAGAGLIGTGLYSRRKKYNG